MASTMKMVEKMGQIVHLKPVMRRWKTIWCLPRRRNYPLSSRPETSSDSSDASSSTWVSSSPSSHIPPGFLAVYVGSERDRFLIRIRFLNLPIFKSLLKKAEEEYGFNFRGGIALPCEVEFFRLVLKHLETDEHKFGRLELDEFLMKLNEVRRCKTTTTSLKIDQLGGFPSRSAIKSHCQFYSRCQLKIQARPCRVQKKQGIWSERGSLTRKSFNGKV